MNVLDAQTATLATAPQERGTVGRIHRPERSTPDGLIEAIRSLSARQVTFDLKPAIHDDEHALHQHTALNAVAQGVAA